MSNDQAAPQPAWEDFAEGDLCVRANPELVQRFGKVELIRLVKMAAPTLDTLPVVPHGFAGKMDMVHANLPDCVLGLFRMKLENMAQPIVYVDTLDRIESWNAV